MFYFGLLLFCFALCQGHSVLPVLPVPAVHSVHPVVAPHSFYHGYGSPALLSHGGLATVGHHLYKRSPFAPIGHVAPIAHVAPLSHLAPVAVSHQHRVDVHSSPAIVAAPVVPAVKPVVTSFVPAVPLAHKPLVGAYGGHYAAGYPNLAHY